MCRDVRFRLKASRKLGHRDIGTSLCLRHQKLNVGCQLSAPLRTALWRRGQGTRCLLALDQSDNAARAHAENHRRKSTRGTAINLGKNPLAQIQ